MKRLLPLSTLFALALLAPAPSATAQFVDEYFSPVSAVPPEGAYAPNVQAAVEEGYRQLEAVTSPSDDAHLDAAETAFEEALEAESTSVHALNGMGMYELAKDEQWLVLLESLKKIFNRDHISMAIKSFEKALEVDPGFLPARFNLGLAYRQARGSDNYRRAAQEFLRVVEADPGYNDVMKLLVLTYRDAGDLAAMRSAIQEAGTDLAGRPTMELLLAYSLINAPESTAEIVQEGVQAYWRGLLAIESEQDAQLYWHDLRAIVTSETNTEFRGVPLDRKPEHIRAYWQHLADQSFVSPDERLAEHYRRLHYVMENFRLDLPERRHYSAIDAYVPSWQTGFDDRGVIYLRHGPPDDTAIFSGPEFERNLSWKYEAADAEPMLFHFVSDEDVGDYKLVRRLSDAVISTNTSMAGQTLLDQNASTMLNSGRLDAYDSRILATQRVALQDLYRSRGHLDPEYDLTAMGLDLQILQEEEARLAQDIQIGTRTQSYEPEPSDPLLYPVYAVPFRSPSGGTEVAFYYALPTTGITILPRGSGSEVDYRYQLMVTSTENPDDIQGRADEEVRIATPQQIPQEPGVMLPGIERVDVGPGQYHYGLKVTDLNSGRFGVLQGSVSVSGLDGPGLAMSGVVLATRVEPAVDTSNPFVRWGQTKVLALPSRLFRREQSIFVYYELYGLDTSAGEARYRTTYTLSAREPDRNVVAKFFSSIGELLSGEEEMGEITFAFERSHPVPADPLLEYVSLDVSESEPGGYTLTVEVEDLSSGQKERREVPLTLTP
ncbi:MAG TPA: GWxTD domain-containing protein [Gemmatimonadota bacterium]|nr:GWxTD domain-containing protein [Gemmatimonadota bacterium]